MKSLGGDTKSKKILEISGAIAISNESLMNLGKLDGSRSSIVDEVLELSTSNDTIIVKWQYGDTLLNTPNALRERLAHFNHRAVKLNVDTQEQVRRLKTKSWWFDYGKEGDFIRDELELVDKSIKELNPAFDVMTFYW